MSLFSFIIAALGSSLLSLVFSSFPRMQKIIAFSLLGSSGFFAVFVGFVTLFFSHTLSYELSSNLLGLVWQLKLDPLASFFLLIVGIIVISIAFYGPEYISSSNNNNNHRQSQSSFCQVALKIDPSVASKFDPTPWTKYLQ